jgi:hypothetical protein
MSLGPPVAGEEGFHCYWSILRMRSWVGDTVFLDLFQFRPTVCVPQSQHIWEDTSYMVHHLLYLTFLQNILDSMLYLSWG